MMVEQREELGNIKHKSTCWEISDPSYTNKIGKSYPSIWSGFEFKTTKLALMDEIVQYYMELESFANDFFDKFTQSIEKNYRSKCF